MTTPTDPTTLRTALEALVDDTRALPEDAPDWRTDKADLYAAGWIDRGDAILAALATPAPAADERVYGDYDPVMQEAIDLITPAADEARCGFAGCGGVRDDVYHEPCLTGGVFHDHKACHPFQPAPTPAPPTPPATEPVAALVEAVDLLVQDMTAAPWLTTTDLFREWFRARLDAIVAAARAEGLDVEALAEALVRVRPYGGNPEAWARVQAEAIADAYLAARARRAGEADDARRQGAEAMEKAMARKVQNGGLTT
jgi:hypothetical protein